MTIIPLTIGLSVTGKNRFRQTGYRFRKINGFNIPSLVHGIVVVVTFVVFIIIRLHGYHYASLIVFDVP